MFSSSSVKRSSEFKVYGCLRTCSCIISIILLENTLKTTNITVYRNDVWDNLSSSKSYLSFSSLLSGVWSTVSLRALPLRHNMARLSPTLATTSSMPSLSSATVAVVPAFVPGPTKTKQEPSEAERADSETHRRSTVTWRVAHPQSRT